MVKCSAEELDGVFGALADPSRRFVVRSLMLGEKTVGDLAEPLGLTTAGMMKHLNVLESSGLVRTEKRGRSRYCQLEPAPLEAADKWIEEVQEVWTKRLNRLNDYLETMD